MTATEQVFGRAEPPRDRYGRYLIVPDEPFEKNPVAHTRATTVAAALESRYALERYGKRQVLLGAAARPDVITRVQSCRPDDKQLLDQLVETCEAAAQNDAKANIGSALHAACETVDLGGLHGLTSPYDADVAAWQKTIESAGISIIQDLVEQICVLPDHKIAGTFDRIVEFGSYRYVLDLKTGSVDYSWCKNAVQLAIYAHSATIYDPVTKQHRAMPQVEQDLALIAHLPAGQGRCDLYWLDIQAGWEAFQHSVWAREWQRRDDLHQHWAPGETTSALGARRIGLVARIQTLAFFPGALDRLAACWPRGVPTLQVSNGHRHTSLEFDQIDAVLIQVEREYQAPFGPNDPAHLTQAN